MNNELNILAGALIILVLGVIVYSVINDFVTTRSDMEEDSVTFTGVVTSKNAPGRLRVKSDSGERDFHFQIKFWQRNIRRVKIGDTVSLTYWDELTKDRPILMRSEILVKSGRLESQ